MGGAFGAISAGFANYIGHGANGGPLFGGDKGMMALAHGGSQGVVSVMRGGQFKEGFLGGFFGKTFELPQGFGGDGTEGVIAGTSFGAMLGGVTTALGGGKFKNGAWSAAFVHLFNAEWNRQPAPIREKEAFKASAKLEIKGNNIGMSDGDLSVSTDLLRVGVAKVGLECGIRDCSMSVSAGKVYKQGGIDFGLEAGLSLSSETNLALYSEASVGPNSYAAEVSANIANATHNLVDFYRYSLEAWTYTQIELYE